MKAFFQKIDFLIEKVEVAGLAATLSVMSILIFTQVILRYIFFKSLFWAEELAMYLMIWVICIGASLATRRKQHLLIDALVRVFPGRMKTGAAFVGNLISGLTCLFMVKVGIDFVMEAREFGHLSTAMQLPLWIVYLALPVTVLLMGYRFMLQAAEELVNLIRGTSGAEGAAEQ